MRVPLMTPTCTTGGMSRMLLRDLEPAARPAARRLYASDPRCSAGEEPVERRATKSGYRYLPDLCSECFRGSVDLFGYEATLSASIRRTP